MHGAIVTSWDQPPAYKTDLSSPPEPTADEVRLNVRYTAAHQLVRGRASGKHPSAKTLPHHPGSDGVGTTADGKVVYFQRIAGTFQQVVNVPKKDVYELPAGVDEATVAAMSNPALSSWFALATRVDLEKLPKDGWTAVILGATTASGIVAASILPLFGANRIIGVARSAAKLSTVAGLTETIALSTDPSSPTDYSKLGEVDVILDYVSSGPAIELLAALKGVRETTYVGIGAVGGVQDLSLPLWLTRMKKLTLRGSGLGSATPEEQHEALKNLVAALPKLTKPGFKRFKLSEIEQVWAETATGDRAVFELP